LVRQARCLTAGDWECKGEQSDGCRNGRHASA